MEKKISIITLILVLIVALLIGIVAGYLITGNMKKENITKEVGSQEIEEQTQVEKMLINTLDNNQQTSTEVTETLKYDGTKEILINGKKHKVSYVSEVSEFTSDNVINEQAELKLYVNDEKVKSLKLYTTFKNKEYVAKEYEVELHSFCKDYIVIAVKTKVDDGEYDERNSVNMCIVTQEGEHIDTLKYDNATSIILNKTKEQLTYEIKENYIILYEEIMGNIYKQKYTVKKDMMEQETLQIYQSDEVSIAGK